MDRKYDRFHEVDIKLAVEQLQVLSQGGDQNSETETA